LLVSIPEFQSTKAIAQRLQLTEALVESSLKILEAEGFVERKQNKWTYRGGDIHLSKRSPFATIHHNSWRQRAMLSSSLGEESSFHYTSLLVLSQKDMNLLRERVMAWVEESRAIAGPSDCEELVCLALDLFKV
jgi:hypothetical protein